MGAVPQTHRQSTARDPVAASRGRIVVGVDGTDAGWSALAWAADEAAVTGSHLTVCRAGHPVPGGSTVDALELADPVLARFVHRTRDRLGGGRVDLVVRAGV